MKKLRFLPIALGIMGVALAYLGMILLSLGGSPYYLFSAAVLIACAILTWRHDRRGAQLYGLFLIITWVWSFYEVGLDAWALAPRVALFTVLGLWFVMPRVRSILHGGAPPPLFRQPQTRLTLAAGLLIGIAIYAANSGYEIHEATALGTGTVNNQTGGWSQYGASKTGTRFAAASQINRDNVDQLERAWEIRTGVSGAFKGTPIQVGDGLYLCTGQNVILALDPDSGEERWRFDPEINTVQFGFWDTCRGVTWYRAPLPDLHEDCSERLFTATTDARLIAVDKDTGLPCSDFGDNGEVDLLAGMGDVKPGFYFVTSPPTIANDVLVLGGWVADNQEVDEPSGVVRGFDPLSGELVWAWDMGREERKGLPPSGESYTRGTPNVWSLTSADEELGLVYVPTGNATPDYFGGHRSEVMERYASSIVALDAATGSVRWHFQTTHHDIWDMDVPSQPTLVDVPIDGEIRRAVIVPTKRGEIFVLDRVTGEPLTAVQELPTAQTDVPEDYTSPTQPFSVGMPSFGDRILTEADMWGVTPFDQAACRIQFRTLRYEGPLTPPSVRGTLLYPGVAGGMNWGSVAVDEINHLMVVNALHMPSVVRLIPRDQAAGAQYGIGGAQRGTPYASFSFFFLSPIFAPCLRPPYGEMAVIDLAAQELLWRRPLGTARDQGPLGIASRLPLSMGMFYSAGSAVTAGGLIFMGGVTDSTLRAIDLYSGRELWTERLPASSEATPMSYVGPSTGKQYVIVTVPEGGGLLQTEAGVNTQEESDSAGGYVIAYALR